MTAPHLSTASAIHEFAGVTGTVGERSERHGWVAAGSMWVGEWVGGWWRSYTLQVAASKVGWKRWGQRAEGEEPEGRGSWDRGRSGASVNVTVWHKQTHGGSRGKDSGRVEARIIPLGKR